MTQFKPLLAVEADLDKLTYPKMASIKLDGIRVLVLNGQAVTRSLKPIPNKHIHETLSKPEFEGLDGEVLCAEPTDPDCYRKTNSAVMGHDGAPDFKFYVFDKHDEPGTFQDRLSAVRGIVECRAGFLRHSHITVNNRAELDQYEALVVEEGHEGVMLRDPGGVYKHGRSTMKEQILLKVKRFMDGEAEVIGVQEEMRNENAATKDALGHTERSTAKAGLIGKGSMGALIVRDVQTGVEFSIGSGFTRADREADWPVGTVVKYKSFAVGVKDKPRFPIFLGVRMKEDMA